MSDILYEKQNGVSYLSFNRSEKLNAFRQQTLEEASDALADASADPSIGAIVISGSGDRAFCVGGDITEMKELDAQSGKAFIQVLHRFAKVMRQLEKPIIAKVRGYCLGGGHEIHLMCDLTYADTSARFGQTGPKVGSVPLWGATQILPQVVGQKKAREIIYLCRQYDAQEALRIGLVNDVTEPEQLDEHVQKVCDEILEKSPQSLRLSRQALEAAVPWHLWEQGLDALYPCYGSDELREGMDAFLEKRKPNFRRSGS